MTEFAKTTNHKDKKITPYTYNNKINNNTAALIESIYIVFYFYIFSFNFFNAPAKYVYSTCKQSTVCFICILFVMCIFLLIFKNKDKIMTKIFIFAHIGLNIHQSFLYFVTSKGFVFIIGKLFWLHCSDNSLIQHKLYKYCSDCFVSLDLNVSSWATRFNLVLSVYVFFSLSKSWVPLTDIIWLTDCNGWS